MKNSIKFILPFIVCLFFTVFLKNEIKAQTATATINYTGFQACGGCTVCGQDYWCFNTFGSWCGNTAACGTTNFTDPVPAGNIITNISIDYFSAGCGPGAMTGTINGVVFPTVNDANNGCSCSSSPCSVAATTGSIFPCGIPSYNYGTTNSFQLCTGADVCINAAVLTFTYVPANQATPATQPGAIVGTSPACVGVAQNYSIPAVANANSYTWTVPAGWTLNSGQGTTGISATPGSSGNICVTATNLCGTSASTCFNVTVNSFVTPAFTQVNPICSGDPLVALPTTSTNGITGTWSPAINNTSTTLYTFTPTAGLCANTATMSITVNQLTGPTFTQVSPICNGDPLAALPTTSTNGVTGTWSPAINNTTTTVYTFSPTAGVCATTTTMSITVNPNVTPTFTQINPICDGDPLGALPTTSTNGITGTWSPATNNTTTTLYTFTPSAGVCATTTTMTITVNPNDDPNFVYASGTYCVTGTDPLPSVITTPGGTFTISAPGSINPTTGLIDLGVSGLGSYTVTYTTPGANPCPSSTTFSIAITSAPTTGFSYDVPQYCQDSLNPVLAMNGGAVAGVFSANSGGLIIDAAGNITLPSSAPGLYTVYNNVAPAGGCAAAIDSTIIEVLQVDSALFSYGNSTYCISEANPIASITGTSGGLFTMTAPGVINAGDGTIGLSASGFGTFTVYYNTTPVGNACPALDSLQITIDSVNTINPNPVIPLCDSDSLFLTASSGGAGVITWYSDSLGTTVIGTGSPFLVLPNPGAGTFTYYVNSVGACSSIMGSVVVIVGGVNAVINAAPMTGAIPLSVFFGNGSTTGPGIGYAWDFGDGNFTNQFEPTNIYNVSGTYNGVLIVTDSLTGCSDTATIIIDAFGESAILIPNVFTPNGDGSNDIFTIEGLNLKLVEGQIFNRWGQLMFSWGNVKGYWDGRTLAGSEAPAGAYFYIIKATGIDGTEYFEKGGVSLVR